MVSDSKVSLTQYTIATMQHNTINGSGGQRLHTFTRASWGPFGLWRLNAKKNGYGIGIVLVFFIFVEWSE